MDLEKLRADWSEPGLNHMAFESVEELAQHLLVLHKWLMGPLSGPLGYLYQQQTRRARELQKELDHDSK